MLITNMIKLILLICVIKVISSQTQTQTQIPCTKDGYKKIDETMSKLTIFGDGNRKFPTTNSEMTKYCR